MYLITLSVFLYTLFYTTCQIGAFEWTDSLPNGTQLEVCQGNTATFPWGFRLVSGERASVVYFRQLKFGSGQGGGIGTPIVPSEHFTFAYDHKMIVRRPTVYDTGIYFIKAMVLPKWEEVSQPHVTTASLLVKARPVLDEGGLQARLQPQVVMVIGGPQPGWHVQFSCGTFFSIGHPAATVTWTTPSGTVLPSTSYENGSFFLIVPNPVESGDYSCQVDPQAPALACASYISLLRRQPRVRVDAAEIRAILLQARYTELATEAPPFSCAALQARYPQSGIQTLTISGHRVQVYCDQDTDGGGWTVIQRRQNGQVDFYRGWDEYVRGFGDIKNEYWLGLENIHQLTFRIDHALRVDLWDPDGTRVYAQYDRFTLEGSSDKYTLHVSGYSGTAGDSLANTDSWSVTDKMAFSTYDRDNDLSPSNCALLNHGAWWYNRCHHANLNGWYHENRTKSFTGLVWYNYKNDHRSFVRTEMKMRPRD